MPEKDEVVAGILIAGVAVGVGYWIYRKTRSAASSHVPPLQIEPIDLTFATKVVDALVAKRALRPTETGEQGKIDRHRVFFIYRRACDLGIADAALREGQGLEALIQRIDQEFEQIEAFRDKNIGTPTARGPYFGGFRVKFSGPVPIPEAAEEGHLDLGRFVSPRVIDPPPTTEVDAVAAATKSESQARTLRELDRRRLRVLGIVWRAAAIDSEVWETTGSSSALQTAALTELLDRRLSSVERLQYEASAGTTPNGIGTSFIDRQWSSSNNPSTISGPWKDDHTVRMFEAPSVPRRARSILPDQWVVQDFFGTSGNVVIDAGHPRFTGGFGPGGPTFFNWYQNHTTDEFDWNDWPGTRMGRDAVAPVKLWVLPPNDGVGRVGYGWILQPVQGGIQAAEILRRLFVSSPDWWERSWLHSDGLLAALHLEALRRAKRRREGNDQLFDALPKRFSLALDDYFEVRAHAVKTANGIMRPGRTDHFENTAIPLDDLQIGDQVLFETNPVVYALGSSAWEYPTVLVTDLDTSPDTASLSLERLRVQGFGTADLEYASLQLLLAKSLDATLKSVQAFIPFQIDRLRQLSAAVGVPFTPPTKLEWDPGVIVTPDDSRANDVSMLRLWNPYGDHWDDPGPWWIWINLRAPMWRGAFGDDAVKILGQIPGGIVWIADDKLLPQFQGRVDPASTLPVGAGFQSPPWQDDPPFGDKTAVPRQTIFVPLFEPEGGWVSYFFDKAADPRVNLGSRLHPVVADASWLPGLAKKANPLSSAIHFRVIRPRLEPAT